MSISHMFINLRFKDLRFMVSMDPACWGLPIKPDIIHF